MLNLMREEFDDLESNLMVMLKYELVMFMCGHLALCT
jgi:hypothetical protein